MNNIGVIYLIKNYYFKLNIIKVVNIINIILLDDCNYPNNFDRCLPILYYYNLMYFINILIQIFNFSLHN